MNESGIRVRKRAAHAVLAAMLGVFLAFTAGCHSSDDDAALPPPVKPSPQSQADAIQKIKDNPNIPPEQKANILSHMQGTAPPPIETGAAKP